MSIFDGLRVEQARSLRKRLMREFGVLVVGISIITFFLTINLCGAPVPPKPIQIPVKLSPEDRHLLADEIVARIKNVDGGQDDAATRR